MRPTEVGIGKKYAKKKAGIEPETCRPVSTVLNPRQDRYDR